MLERPVYAKIAAIQKSEKPRKSTKFPAPSEVVIVRNGRVRVISIPVPQPRYLIRTYPSNNLSYLNFDLHSENMSYEELSREELIEALHEMEKKYDEERSEREKFEELAKKTKADFENYKKKQDERKERWQEKARQELAEDLIEVIDNLERALMAAEEETAVVQGVEMVNEQLYETLSAKGLEVIETGEKFDPEVHKAVDTREHEEQDPKTILEEKRKGYLYNDKVLRPAEVVVAEEPKDED